MKLPLVRELPTKKMKDKVCLLRLDFNTQDAWRMQASLPTIQLLRRHCRAILILSHKGRPHDHDPKLSLKKETQQLSQLLKTKVAFFPKFNFPEIQTTLRAASRGSVFILENLRFLKEEGADDARFAKTLAGLGDFYVNDAFAVSHRNNASVTAITRYLPSYAGLELEAEITHLSKVMRAPQKPLVVIMGGAKIEKKLIAFRFLKPKTEIFLIGGLLTRDIFKRKDPQLLLPIDVVQVKGIIQDIGPKTIRLFAERIQRARTIIWNGPLGNIEKKKFTLGTKMIARAVSKNRSAFKVVGGGETVMFLKELKLESRINFISTGGGAMLEFLSGKKLPGIEALRG